MEAGRIVAGRYRLLEPLGRGGFGSVWAAERVDRQERVAIKLLDRQVSHGADEIERFLREARASDDVPHPAVVQVFDSGVDEGQPYLVMELLIGRSGAAVFADPAGTMEGRLRLLEGILDPLAAAHDHGIVHRDLKPINLFETPRGVKLLDFGLARRLGEAGVTRTGMVIGSAHYMSPEQAHDAKSVGTATDVWSFGAMLYEALCGHPPFQGSTGAAVIVKIVTESAPPLVGAPSELSDLAMSCLSQDTARRPRDGAELRDCFRPALARLSESARASTMVADGALPSVASLPATSLPSAPSVGVRPSRAKTPRWLIVALPLAAALGALVVVMVASSLTEPAPVPPIGPASTPPPVTAETLPDDLPIGAELPEEVVVAEARPAPRNTRAVQAPVVEEAPRPDPPAERGAPEAPVAAPLVAPAPAPTVPVTSSERVSVRDAPPPAPTAPSRTPVPTPQFPAPTPVATPQFPSAPTTPAWTTPTTPPSSAQMVQALESVHRGVAECAGDFHGELRVRVSFRPDGTPHANIGRLPTREARVCVQSLIHQRVRVRPFQGRPTAVDHDYRL